MHVASTYRRLLTLLLVTISTTFTAAIGHAQLREDNAVRTSSQVLEDIMAVQIKSIPHSLLADAQAIAIVPNVVKGSFVVGVRHGKGVVIVRDETGGWRPPQFVSLTGGSVAIHTFLPGDTTTILRCRPMRTPTSSIRSSTSTFSSRESRTVETEFNRCPPHPRF